jgi:predicted hydrocarbon binding protein
MSSIPTHKPQPAVGELLQADLGTGILRHADGRRSAVLSIDFVQQLHFTLLEQFGDAAQDVLYRSGYEWGLQSMLQLNTKVSSEAAPKLWQRDSTQLFRTWWEPLQEDGWGAAAFDFSRLGRGVVVVVLQQSAVAAALEGTDQPVCHFYAGLFGGAASFFQRAERHAVELECRALGHPACRFVIGSAPDIDAAEAARQQGASTAAILQKLA